MHQRLALAIAVPAAAVVALIGTVAVSPANSAPYAPAGDTIVEVTGDAANGFEIHHYDGTSLFPPTDSEARAECSEYDKRIQRVRCRVEVRTWYRDLGDLKQALAWAHASD